MNKNLKFKFYSILVPVGLQISRPFILPIPVHLQTKASQATTGIICYDNTIISVIGSVVLCLSRTPLPLWCWKCKCKLEHSARETLLWLSTDYCN
jgi:hypothetical protein